MLLGILLCIGSCAINHLLNVPIIVSLTVIQVNKHGVKLKDITEKIQLCLIYS